MKNKSIEKGKAYALSANSKLASRDFSQMMGWASKIYALLKQYENWFCSDVVFRRLKKKLLELYATDHVHTVGNRQMCAGDVALLKKWRVNNYSQWSAYLNIKPLLHVDPKVGKVVLALNDMILEKGKLVPRASAAAMRFYLLFLDELNGMSSSMVIDELIIPVESKQEALEASFNFEPMVHGVLLLLGVCQLHLLDKRGQDSFASQDKRYCWANIMETIAIRGGVVVSYEKKDVLPAAVMNVAKVGWVKRGI